MAFIGMAANGTAKDLGAAIVKSRSMANATLFIMFVSFSDRSGGRDYNIMFSLNYKILRKCKHFECPLVDHALNIHQTKLHLYPLLRQKTEVFKVDSSVTLNRR